VASRYLNMMAYPRRQHLAYFRQLAYPYVGTTVNVKITMWREWVKANKLPFFLSFCYCAAHAANAIPEFRQRLRGEAVVEYDWCKTSHTVALENGTYAYCTLNSRMPFEAYIPYAVETQEKAKAAGCLMDKEEEAESLLFVSTLPWITYTALIQPVPMPADSNPRITWGKAFEQDGETFLPVSVLCHHGLADGLHIARFYQVLDDELQKLAETGMV